MNTKIISTGSYLPENILTNSDLEKMVDTDDEWIVQRTGIKVRHIADDESTSDIAYKAALDAINRIHLDPLDIDLIILATVTPDMPLPATALFVQEKLGAKNAFCFDVNAACSGFMYGLSIANAYIKTGMVRKALVIGAEELSKITDWTDRSTCIIFGDGAACAVLDATDYENKGILDIRLKSDGAYTNLMRVPAPGSIKQCSKEVIENREIYIKMLGNETFKMSVRHITSISRESLESVGLKFSDVDCMVCHQANKRIIDAVARRIKLPAEKAVITIDRHGNTAAASIPLALDWANKNGKIKENDILLLNSFGASLTWAASVIRW